LTLVSLKDTIIIVNIKAFKKWRNKMHKTQKTQIDNCHKKTYYIKMRNGINYKVDDVTLLELYKTINNLCSKLCINEDNIILIICSDEYAYTYNGDRKEMRKNHVTLKESLWRKTTSCN
tara:strand:+ start:137 stop:493 length:357 start_codon:yes stop_codon:yes gene_type:complete